MARSLNELEQSLAYDLGQDSVTVDSTDWNRYKDHLNRGIRDWAGRHNWRVLRQSATVSVLQSTATYSLTSTFQDPLGSVWITKTDSSIDEYPIIKAEDKHEKSTSERFAWITGNKSDGFSVNINPSPTATQVGTNNLEYWYVKQPAVLTNSADTCEIPDEDALIGYGRMKEHERDDEDAKASIDRQEWELRINDMIAKDTAGPESARDFSYAKSQEEVEGYTGVGKE